MSENGLEILFFIYNILGSLFGLPTFFVKGRAVKCLYTDTMFSTPPRWVFPPTLASSPPPLERPSALNSLPSPPLIRPTAFDNKFIAAALESAGSSRTFFPAQLSVDFRIRSEFSSIAYFILTERSENLFSSGPTRSFVAYVFSFSFFLSLFHPFTLSLILSFDGLKTGIFNATIVFVCIRDFFFFFQSVCFGTQACHEIFH